jgi:hypothetical protein
MDLLEITPGMPLLFIDVGTGLRKIPDGIASTDKGARPPFSGEIRMDGRFSPEVDLLGCRCFPTVGPLGMASLHWSIAEIDGDIAAYRGGNFR